MYLAHPVTHLCIPTPKGSPQIPLTTSGSSPPTPMQHFAEVEPQEFLFAGEAERSPEVSAH